MPPKEHSARRRAVFGAAMALFAPATAQAIAAPPAPHKVQAGKEPRRAQVAKRLADNQGGGSGPLSLEWKIITTLRP